MSEFKWLPSEVIVDLHAELLAEHKGAAGLRDENALHSALARPQNIAAYEPDATVFRLAAAYAFGLTQNHAFVDGNKRIAFAAAGTFLGLNGWYLDALESDAEQKMLALSAKEIDEAAFTDWLERHSVRS